MISDAQVAMLRLLSKDVAIAVDRAVKAKMQEQRISQGQLLLQTTRLLCSLQSQEQIVEAACQCACELLHADSCTLVDCGGLSGELYDPVEIGGPKARGQVFEAFVWQKVKAEDSDLAVSSSSDGDDLDGGTLAFQLFHFFCDFYIGQLSDDDDSVAKQQTFGDDPDSVDDSAASRQSVVSAAAFIRSIFNRAPPPPSSLRDAWCDRPPYSTISHITSNYMHRT
jgi:hypothetical protein